MCGYVTVACSSLIGCCSLLFWTNYAQPRRVIEKADLDGTSHVTLILLEVLTPSGLTLDPVNRKLYWLDAMLDDSSLQRIQVSHGNRH